ncbi:type II toxin-antitoxin system VapC family toxin [Corynebacterium aquatimens]|nr:type II toxin-antitoxin system VapC family toxin [Corynebacterium aquatimens]UIZ93271.1 type II toxin-antitoxin system VapC family toxin [Corynebacterium sp. CNCTC7651]
MDTSLAVPLLLGTHNAHESVKRWAKGRELTLCAHSLVETYSVLTRLPGDNRLAGSDAVQVIDDNFPKPLMLPDTVGEDIHRRLAKAGVLGGATYDGIVALTALENGVPLASRDRRAVNNYLSLGVEVQLVN